MDQPTHSYYSNTPTYYEKMEQYAEQTKTFSDYEKLDVEALEETKAAENSSTLPESLNNEALLNHNDDRVMNFEPIQNMHQLWEPETKIFLARTMGLFITIFLVSVFMLLRIHVNFPYDPILLVGQAYFSYNIVIDMVWTRRVVGDQWIIKDWKMLNNSAFSVTIYLAYLTYLKVLRSSFLTCIPFLMLTAISAIYSDEARKEKLLQNFRRIIYALLVLLINLKIDGNIDCNWSWLLALPCIYASIKGFHCFKYAFFIIKLGISILLQRNQSINEDASTIITKILGYFWCTMYYGLSLIGILALVGICQAYSGAEPKDFRLLDVAACEGVILSVVLAIYTQMNRNSLIKFIIMTQLIESYLVNDEINRRRNMRIVSLETEKKEAHFLMVSNTYFLPLYEGFNARNQKDIEMVQMKLNNSKLERIGASNQTEGDAGRQMPEDDETMKETEKASKTTINIKNNYTRENEDHLKISLGLEDSNTPSNDKNTQKVQEESHLCYICCMKQPDAILIGCGHGGVCFDCVSTLVKKKDECMACRTKIAAIYRINPVPVLPNVFKSIEINKVIMKNYDQANV